MQRGALSCHPCGNSMFWTDLRGLDSLLLVAQAQVFCAKPLATKRRLAKACLRHMLKNILWRRRRELHRHEFRLKNEPLGSSSFGCQFSCTAKTNACIVNSLEEGERERFLLKLWGRTAPKSTAQCKLYLLGKYIPSHIYSSSFRYVLVCGVRCREHVPSSSWKAGIEAIIGKQAPRTFDHRHR